MKIVSFRSRPPVEDDFIKIRITADKLITFKRTPRQCRIIYNISRDSLETQGFRLEHMNMHTVIPIRIRNTY